MINACSVRDKLKNNAKKQNKTFQEELIAYGLERTIYRIALSKYLNHFTLKGGVLLYALFDGDFTRVTRDIDFLASQISNSTENIKRIFIDIFSMVCDDALTYDLDTLEVKSITEFKKYHGVNVSITSYLDKTRIPISIDIGFGDIVYPEKELINYPVLLEMENPVIYAYSIYSVISEKFEAIVALGDANSRYKDFYDIFLLANRYDLEGYKLQDAIRKTFMHRGTSINEIFAFSEGFVNSDIHQNRWNAFLKKKKTLVSVELSDAIEVLKILLLPIVDSINDNGQLLSVWDHNLLCWK